MKPTGCDLAVLGGRMKVAREALGLNQAQFHDKFVGGTLRSFQRAEAGANEAGICLVEVFVRAGINANWLLTGEGPMLLANLAPKPVPAPQINVDALVQAFCVSLATAPKGETPEQSARKAVQFYLYCLNTGMITPTGEGTGPAEKTA